MLMSAASVAEADDGAVVLARAASMMDVCCLRYVDVKSFSTSTESLSWNVTLPYLSCGYVVTVMQVFS